MRTYAIGDIHGQLALLKEAHARIAKDRQITGDDAAPVVHVGDLVDRGPDSCATLDYMLDGLERGAPWEVLKGNHDRLMQRFLEDADWVDPYCPHLHWLDGRLGGRATLASYGVDISADRTNAEIRDDAEKRIPNRHRSMLANLSLSVHRGDAFFCHAGVRPGVPLDAQIEDDLLWIRRDFLESREDHGALVVHGHTPVDLVMHAGNHLNIDTGAAYGGPLSVVVVESGVVSELTSSGRLLVPAP